MDEEMAMDIDNPAAEDDAAAVDDSEIRRAHLRVPRQNRFYPKRRRFACPGNTLKLRKAGAIVRIKIHHWLARETKRLPCKNLEPVPKPVLPPRTRPQHKHFSTAEQGFETLATLQLDERITPYVRNTSVHQDRKIDAHESPQEHPFRS